MAARILWAFDYRAPVDTAGKAMLPDPNEEEAWSDGFISSPYPFNVSWKVRDAKREAVLIRAYEDAQEEWKTRGMDTDER